MEATIFGWKCPECHTVYAPFVQKCLNCTPVVRPNTDPTKKCGCRIENGGSGICGCVIPTGTSGGPDIRY